MPWINQAPLLPNWRLSNACKLVCVGALSLKASAMWSAATLRRIGTIIHIGIVSILDNKHKAVG
jgi:hypothetical protein